MSYSTHSTVEYLAQRLLQRWVPKWFEAFSDPVSGGFYERLGRQFKPVSTGQRRLLTQCRQLALYSHASLHNGFSGDLGNRFESIIRAYRGEHSGGFRFSTDDNGAPLDNSYDLYSLSFVIFSASHYFRVSGDPMAEQVARQTLDFINAHFRLPGHPGLAEAIDDRLAPLPRLRRQNPHMHLLEACLFAADTWNDPAYRVMADEMVDLFTRYFYDPAANRLSEFFTDDLQPDPEKGVLVEPGHYCEWVWLLKKHAGTGTQHDATCARLLEWANRYGWDGDYGGIYDVLQPDGTVTSDTKRLWPFTEALKANALMLDSGMDKDALKQRMADMVNFFRDQYMDERGFWVEWLNRDLTPATDYMPGTTPYHVYFGIMETRAALHARGRTKSWAAGPRVMGYTLRRQLSGYMRRLRRAILQS